MIVGDDGEVIVDTGMSPDDAPRPVVPVPGSEPDAFPGEVTVDKDGPRSTRCESVSSGERDLHQAPFSLGALRNREKSPIDWTLARCKAGQETDEFAGVDAIPSKSFVPCRHRRFLLRF